MTTYIKDFSILGFRGFSERQKISFSVPNGIPGSGLTILTGDNNSGKTSVLESLCISCLANQDISFSRQTRNKNADYRIDLELTTNEGSKYETKTNPNQQTKLILNRNGSLPFELFYLGSRRRIDNKINGAMRRDQYANTFLFHHDRWSNANKIAHRLALWMENKDKVNKVLYELIGRNFEWNIDEITQGDQHGLILRTKEYEHYADGMGDGLSNIFHIVDALYDIPDNGIVVIDEPEGSLNPFAQKRVFELLRKVSASHQVLIATHSPNFISFQDLSNGASLYRVVNRGTGVKIHAIDSGSVEFFSAEVRNFQGSYLVGVEAREVFFIPDNVIVCEGQDDVYLIKKLFEHLNININANFYGYGAGGCGKIPKIVNMLKNLGYSKVLAIYDKSKDASPPNQGEYLNVVLPTFDIRDKIDCNGKQITDGIFDKGGNIKMKNDEIIFKAELLALANQVSDYFK